MGRKHKLIIVSAFIMCFMLSAIATDIVISGAQEALQMQDNVFLVFDTNESEDLNTSYDSEQYVRDLEGNSGLFILNVPDESTKIDVNYLQDDILSSYNSISNDLNEDMPLNDKSEAVTDAVDDAYAAEDIYDADDVVYDEVYSIQNISYIEETVMTAEYDKVIADVSESMNIRKEPSTHSEIVGRLFKDSYGTILERGEEWTMISSGNVIGYAHNDYLLFDDDARAFVDEKGALVVEVMTGGVNIRSMPTTESDIMETATKGSVFPANTLQVEEEWNAVDYNGVTAYIYKELSRITLNLDTAKTMEEITKKEKEEKIANALASAKNVNVGDTSRKAISISDEEIYLMATVIASEALSESYEGKLAVANVIINRLLTGSWGNTITSVIYAPRQFSGSDTGRFDKFEKLMTEDCKKAAIEALAGVNNIDDFLFFISLPKAKYDKYSKYYILGGHCFYMR